MIVPFEAHCSWHLCQIQAQHLEQHFCAETRFKLRLQIGSPSQGFLITSLISPISWGCLPCKPHKVRISTLIKPSFSDNSRVLKISDCYLRAVECHSCLSPPTVTLNAVIKWGRVLLSLSSHSSPWSGSSSVCSKKKKAFHKPHKQVSEGGRRSLHLSCHWPILTWFLGQRRNFQVEGGKLHHISCHLPNRI